MERSQCTISERSKLRIVYMIFFVWERETEAEDCYCESCNRISILRNEGKGFGVTCTRSCLYLGTDFSTEYLLDMRINICICIVRRIVWSKLGLEKTYLFTLIVFRFYLFLHCILANLF